MGGTGGTARNGSRHYYYQCNGRKTKKTSCTKKPEQKERIEKLVVKTVIHNILMDEKVINYIIDRCMIIQEKEADNSTAEGLRWELAEAEKSLKNIMSAIEAGIITSSTKNRLIELEERCANLRQGIAAAEYQPPKISREQLQFIFEKYQNRDINDVNYIREIIDTFIYAVYIFDDKIIITFNYSDNNTVEISNSEIMEAADKAVTVPAADGFYSCGVASTTCK